MPTNETILSPFIRGRERMKQLILDKGIDGAITSYFLYYAPHIYAPIDEEDDLLQAGMQSVIGPYIQDTQAFDGNRRTKLANQAINSVFVRALRDIASRNSATHGDCAAKVLDENARIASEALKSVY